MRTLVEAFKRGGPAEVRKQQKEPGGLSRLCGLELGGGHRGYRDIGFIELKAYAQQALWVGVGGGSQGL